MTPQGAFLFYVKARRNGLLGPEPAKVLQVDKLWPVFKRITRDVPLGDIFSQRVDTGEVDRNTVELHAKSHGFYVSLTAEGVKRQVRRLRPQEAARLARIDAELEQVRQRQYVLVGLRRDVLRSAFTNGHQVTVKELRQAAEAGEPIIETVEVTD